MRRERIDLLTIRSLSPPAVDQAHLWMYDISAAEEWSASIESILSPTEKELATRFVSVGARNCFIAGRTVLRRLLGAYLSTPATDIALTSDAGGKPRLVAAGGILPIKFNLAHSADCVLLGFATSSEIGVDIEHHRPILHWQAIAERHYSSREFAALQESNEDSQRELFFRIWTRKEAVLKWHGTGLQTSLSSIEVPIDSQCRTWVELPQSGQRCWLQQLDAPTGYSAAVATSHAITQVVQRRVGQAFLPDVQ
jgi:4'-phosphopantetheinyl transferase